MIINSSRFVAILTLAAMAAVHNVDVASARLAGGGRNTNIVDNGDIDININTNASNERELKKDTAANTNANASTNTKTKNGGGSTAANTSKNNTNTNTNTSTNKSNTSTNTTASKNNAKTTTGSGSSGSSGAATNGCSGGVNCAVSANRGATDRASVGYETINSRGVFERVPCRHFNSQLVKAARDFAGAASECLVPNGCSAYGACCRVTRTLVCDVGNKITTPPCVCSINTIGGFDAPFGNYTDANNVNFTFNGGF